MRKEIQSVGDGAADDESVDLVFEVFDKNRDGEISTGEWVGEDDEEHVSQLSK